MFWMLVGCGALVAGAANRADHADSAGIAELRNHLPPDLRDRVERIREATQNRHDTLVHLTPSERSRWADSLVREILVRRAQALDTLAPAERLKMEERMQDLELQSGTRSRPSRLRDPGMGPRP